MDHWHRLLQSLSLEGESWIIIIDMAYMLSLMPHSPLATPYSERTYERSWSSLGSTGTVHHRRARQPSVGSLASAASFYATSWRSSGNSDPLRSTSFSDHTIRRASSSCTRMHSPGVVPASLSDLPATAPEGLISVLPKSPGREMPLSVAAALKTDPFVLDLVDEEDIDPDDEVGLENIVTWHTATEGNQPNLEDTTLDLDDDLCVTVQDASQRPFSRWMSTLRRKKAAHKRRIRAKIDGPAEAQSSPLGSSPVQRHTSRHRKSESFASSMRFVTAVKSATVTLAGTSIAPLSRNGTRRSGRPRLWRGSSGFFESEPRRSAESAAPSLISIVDEAARQRSIKRREKLEELIQTEESYVADLRALSNVSFLMS